MANVVVVGAQWGDEGKGKIVDWLSERADVIARFQGGHNAGHTLVIGETVYKLHALPSGVVRAGKLSIIGNGVVLDPWHLLKEIETIRAQGVEITPETLMIAENTPLILPFHGELDRAREAQNSVAKIGTTGRGIGPAYEDKVGRRVIRVADLADDSKSRAAMIETGKRLRDEDGANVLIMGCAGMARYRAPLEQATGLPVVEPTQAAASAALGQIRLSLSHKMQRPNHA